MRIFLLLFISFIWFSNAVGQTGPKSFTSQSILFTSATIHTGDGKVIENGILAVKDKKIAFVGKSSDLPGEMTPPCSATAPPESPVPAPRAVNGTLLSRIRLTSLTTSAVDSGKKTPSGLPRSKPASTS